MFKLWNYAELDLFDENNSYRLSDTGKVFKFYFKKKYFRF
jgi:hypothetical protein